MNDKEKQIEICENCKIKDTCSNRILVHMEKCKVNDCDYYCESTDREKQIEEMASTMAECNTTCDECFEKLERVMTMKIKERENYCQAYLFAQRLYNAGYRNCKDKVVRRDKDIVKNLKREIEFWKCRSDQKNQILERFAKRESDRLRISRKETAMEIIEMLVPPCEVCDENWHKGCLCLRAKIAEKIAKQYGVEIKE